MVSIDGAIRVLGANARTAWAYSPTRASAKTQRNHVDESEIRFGAIFENLWEANTCALIVCSSYNDS
jgi:hypothetical protein